MKAFIALLLLPLTAFADVGLAMRCDGISAPTQAAACAGPRAWAHPVPGDTAFVLSFPTVPADSTTISWNDPALQFRPWVSIPGNYGVLTCTKDLSPDQTAIVTADNCAPGGDPVAKVFVAAANVAITPPVVLTNGTANLAWKAPSANVDGSLLTDLKGFDVYQGSSPTTLVKITTTPLGAGATSYVVTGLPNGTYYFGITSLDSGGNVSDLGISNEATATKTVTKKPGAPTNVTATISVTVP